MERGSNAKYARDITGQRFGRLTAVCPTDRRLCGHVVWECRCDCGRTAFVPRNNLIRGNTQSCGCMHSQAVSESTRNDLSGQRFGRLTAVYATDRRISGSVVWECRCDCGNTVLVSAASLCKGDTASCGCLHREKLAKRRKVDLTGQRFGYLSVLHATDRRVRGCIVWTCKCDCGGQVDIPSERLTGGQKISCGCITRTEYRRLQESKNII